MYYATEDIKDTCYITETMVRYAKSTTATEGKVNNLKQQLAQLEMESQMGGMMQ